MAKILRPRRGKHEYATSQNIVLNKGELFLSYTNTNYGTGDSINRLYLGDGSTSFDDLKPFLSNSTVTTTDIGLCPKLPNDTTKFLRGDGTWAVPPDNNTTYDFSPYTPLATFNNRFGIIEIRYSNFFTKNSTTNDCPYILIPSSFTHKNASSVTNATTYNKTNISVYHYGYYTTTGNNKFYSVMNGNEESVCGRETADNISSTWIGQIPIHKFDSKSDDLYKRSMIYCSPGKYLYATWGTYTNGTSINRVCNYSLYSSTQCADITKFTPYFNFLARPISTYDTKVCFNFLDTSSESTGRYFILGGRNEGGNIPAYEVEVGSNYYNMSLGYGRLTMIKIN